jgi:hypothetical protein
LNPTGQYHKVITREETDRKREETSRTVGGIERPKRIPEQKRTRKEKARNEPEETIEEDPRTKPKPESRKEHEAGIPNVAKIARNIQTNTYKATGHDWKQRSNTRQREYAYQE